MRAVGVCRVLATKSPLARPGDLVVGYPGWSQYAVLRAGRFEPSSAYPPVSQPQDLLSTMGMTSMTAWVGTNLAEIQPGETVVISGAAGATGSVAGQIAKRKGARVIGIAGSDDKCRWLIEELGFDAALNYKVDDFKDRFAAATPDFIDVYFDNVGGDILDLCLLRAKEHARFIECGNVSQYNSAKPQGPRYFSQIITMRIKVQGFIVIDHIKDFPRARKEIAAWGLKKSETIIKGGLGKAEQALVDLFKGINTGMFVVWLLKTRLIVA